MAWRNLGRNRRRTALALAAIAIAQTAVLAMDGLMNGWHDSILETMTGPMLGHVQLHAPEWREDRAPDLVINDLERTLANVRATPGVRDAYARIYAPALVAREIDGHAMVVIGINIEAERAPGGLLEGLPEAGVPPARGALVGSALARDLGVSVGDELALLGQGADGSMANDLVTVTGLLETPVDLVNRMGLVVHLAAAQEVFAMPDQAHEINVRGTGGVDGAPALAQALRQTEGVEALEVLTWDQVMPELAQMLDVVSIYGLVVLLIVFLAAAAGVANTMMMATFERRRELGMLLSLGTSPGRVVAIVVSEAVVLGVLGVLIGTLIGGLLVLYQGHIGISFADMAGTEGSTDMAMYGVNVASEIYPSLGAGDYVPGFLGVVVVSVLAALWPAVIASRLEPVEAMRG